MICTVRSQWKTDNHLQKEAKVKTSPKINIREEWRGQQRGEETRQDEKRGEMRGEKRR